MTFSIGDVLEQLSDDFPDITVSKIRFLESQGLIAPMRTSSGFRMFSDTDITKLKWILIHQRDRFLPLKVIKEYLSTVSDDAFADGNMPAFDFESSGALALEGTESATQSTSESAAPVREVKHLAAVPSGATAEAESNVSQLRPREDIHAKSRAQSQQAHPGTTIVQEAPAKIEKESRERQRMARRSMRAMPSPIARDNALSRLDVEALVGSTEAMTTQKSKATKTEKSKSAVLSLEAMTTATGISGPNLKELVRFGVLEATGTGNSIVFHNDEVALAKVIAPLLERGIEVRHVKNYALFAAREVGFLEHVVQEDLHKRNPQATAIAQEKAKQFIQDTARLKEMLLLRAMKKETD